MRLGRRPRLQASGVVLAVVPGLVVPIWVALFFLTQFSPTGEVICVCRPVDLPWTGHAQELTLAPVVEVRRGDVVLGGELLGRIRALDVEAAAARFAERLGRPGEERTVIIAAEGKLTFAAVWPVMEAAFRSGAPTVSLAVAVPR